MDQRCDGAQDAGEPLAGREQSGGAVLAREAHLERLDPRSEGVPLAIGLLLLEAERLDA